jgi:hypothetical protein
MPDWRMLAAARGLSLPEDDLARVEAVLDELHAVLCERAAAIPLTAEPLISFRCETDEDAL